MMPFPRTQAVLDTAVASRTFSAVSAEIGGGDGAVWTYASGRLSFDDAAPRVGLDTIFDLASLTKVIASTTIALQQITAGELSLGGLAGDAVPEWSGADRRGVTVRDLLEHCSGLPAHRDYFRTLTTEEQFVRAIAGEPLTYTPRSRAIYSDLGFILLGRVLANTSRSSLDRQFDRWRGAAGITQPLAYCPPVEWRDRTACTEHDAWRGRVLQGEVHDENAAALGGVASHAGLFGTAAAVGEAARWWLRLLLGQDDRATGVTSRAAQSFVQRSTVPGSSRACGWDTMLPSSSCGTRMSSRAVGHTGFTGTSLWIDLERPAYFVLLTNRVHPTRRNDAIQQVRRAFHDGAADDLAHLTHL